MEIFDTLEAIPAAPKKLIDGFLSWAKGEQVRGGTLRGGLSLRGRHAVSSQGLYSDLRPLPLIAGS